jgi:glucokinase
LHSTPLRQLLADRLGLPVALEHDAKAAALGEYHYGAGRGERSMVYVVVGTGVGAAIIVDGELFCGSHNVAGEIGHTTLDPGGPVCSCGNRGCVETYLAGPWLARRFRRLVSNPADEAVGAPPLPSVTGELVARLAALGDARAKRVMNEAGQALGTAVATMAMVLDIDLFVVGSSVAKAGDLLLQPARDSVPLHAYASVACRVRIVPTTLGDDGPVLGCAWLARRAAGVI